MSTHEPMVLRHAIEGAGLPVEVKKEPEEESLPELPDFEQIDMGSFQCPVDETKDTQDPQQDPISIKSEKIKEEEIEVPDVPESAFSFNHQPDIKYTLKTERTSFSEDSTEGDHLPFKQEEVEDAIQREENTDLPPSIAAVTDNKSSSTTLFQRLEATETSYSPMEIKTEENVLKCCRCEKVFSKKRNLLSHMASHSDVRPFKCLQCEKRFAQSFHLKMHIRMHTGERPYSCLQCEKSFARSSDQKKHMRAHSGDRPYSCSQCEKSFPLSSDLTRHVRTHTGERPFICVHCEKSFARSTHMKSHMRTHADERRFTCLQCGKSFTQASDLKVHMRTHSGERPFSCVQCGKSFLQSFDLTRHMRTHTGERPFNCVQCEKTFTRFYDLKSHVGKTHTGTPLQLSPV